MLVGCYGIGWKLRFGTSRLCTVMLCTWFSWTPRLLTLIEVKGNRVVAALPLHLVSVSGRLDWLDRKPHSPDTKILQLVVQYFLLNSYCETGKCDSLLNVTFFKLKKGCQLTENWRIMWQSLMWHFWFVSREVFSTTVIKLPSFALYDPVSAVTSAIPVSDFGFIWCFIAKLQPRTVYQLSLECGRYSTHSRSRQNLLIQLLMLFKSLHPSFRVSPKLNFALNFKGNLERNFLTPRI